MLYPAHKANLRSFALLYFMFLILTWNLLGHTILGFEQSWAQLIVAAGSACAAQLFLDIVDAKANNREFRLKGGIINVLTFFAPAMISGLALGMLLYPNQLLLPLVFASVLAIGSKVMFRAPIGGGKTQHIFNPSNFAIVVTLFLCPWISIAPPYHFMVNAEGAWNWVVPAIVLISGLAVHGFATGRLPLVLGWLGGFLTQAFLRHLILGIPLAAPLIPMTGTAFVIFTLYMIPDPATTPINWKTQVAFGLAVAAVYATIQVSHQVYGLFGALVLVSLARGISLYVIDFWRQKNQPAAQIGS
jgi:Na+-translocating ferredoxin:NAD+ oxidoreductase RnfD subunit